MEIEIQRKYIDDLTLAYFHEDYQLPGEKTDEIMADYLNCQYPITLISLIIEINNFIRNSDDVEKYFHSFNYDKFSPELR
ncbi:contact-dependent growth inhibition system immunity protein [Photorhabdus australis]|nr:contact-dependent growth inhibition system immunity protein [Photorhabdus australis]